MNTLYIKTYTNTQDQLTKPFTWYFDERNKHNGITVPRGFTTDYASVPRVCLPFLPKIGKSRKPAVVHDYLYSKNNNYFYNRRQADKIFYYGLRAMGIGLFKAGTIYLIVRIFGFTKYKKK